MTESIVSIGHQNKQIDDQRRMQRWNWRA
jgi:hypothetical protein